MSSVSLGSGEKREDWDLSEMVARCFSLFLGASTNVVEERGAWNVVVDGGVVRRSLSKERLELEVP